MPKLDSVDMSPNGTGEEEQQTEAEREEAEKRKKHSLAYLKALRDSTKAHAAEYMRDFHRAWGYVIGEKRFPAPANQAAKQVEKHLARTVRPRLFATIDHKVSVITDAEPRVIMKTLQTIPEQERRQLESVLEAELERLRWQEDRLATAWD